MDKIKWVGRTMTFVVEGVWLEDISGTPVWVERELLEELATTDGFFDAVVVNDPEIKAALKRAGLAHEKARGSLYATDKLRSLVGND